VGNRFGATGTPRTRVTWMTGVHQWIGGIDACAVLYHCYNVGNAETPLNGEISMLLSSAENGGYV
jgi:hypothetical protein